MLRVCLWGFACLAFAACRPESPNVTMPDYHPDPELKADLAQAAGRRVFFGHQSVGANVVEGLEELRALAGDTALRVIHDPAAADLPPAFFAETKLGKNGEPLGKLAAFRRMVDTTLAGRLDVALVKICYVDLARDAGVDPDSLFAAYRKTLSDLEAAHPGLLVIPVTSPLTTSSFGARGRLDLLKGALKRWLGRPDDNARRAVFNAHMREAFRDRPIFDIAAIESTRPDGTRVRYGKDSIEALAPEYSLDGGHLNGFGRKVAARALLRVLAHASVGAPRPNT
jgi:hypothetical protein